jgi:hypothetical protein
MALKFLNNATFAGTIGSGAITSTSNIEAQDTFVLNYNNAGNKWQQLFDGSNGWNLRYYNGSSWSSNYLNVNTSGNATFAGTGTFEGGILHLGKADTASGHINAKELMTFNIDTDNDDTNRYFGFYVNGESGSGTELLKILETGDATFAGDVTTDGIFKVDTAPDDNILEVTQSGRKMALKTSFAGDTVGSFWAFRVSNGNVNGGTTDALIVRPQNATFAGNVTVGHDLKMPTNGEIDWNAGAVKLIGTADDIKLQGGSLSITGDGSNAVTLTESGNGDFTIDAPDDIRLDAGGGDIVLKSAGTEYGRISKLSSDLSITSSATNSDILINPNGNGNVGIGTTSPSDKLEIGNLSNYTGLTLKGAGASRPAVTFKNVSQSLLGSIYGTESRGMIIETGGNGTLGTVAMTLSSTGALKLNTYTAGTLVSDASGNITVSSGGGAGGPYLPLAGGTMTGNTKHNDNVFSYWGNNDDLAIRHNATDTYIENYTGDLQIVNYADDKDIIFKSDDGSGGTATYFRVDGGAVETRFLKSTRHFDDVGAYFGDSADLQIYHTGNDSYIKDAGTGDLRIVASLTKIYDADMSHLQASFTDGGSVDLYYSGNKKFETTNTGIKTGNIDLPSNGAILFDNTNNTEQYYIRNGGGSQSSFQIGKGNPGSDIKLIIDDGGNVGIGTTAPGEKLVIAGGVLAYGDTSSIGSGTSYYLGNNPNSRDIVFTRVANAELGIGRYNGGWYETMRFDADGNVGIGTTSPSSRLTVKAAGSQTTQRAITIFHDNTLAEGYASIGAQYTATNGYIDSEIRFGSETLNGACSFMSFATGCNNTITQGSNSERMRITSTGNVGIGTTLPGTLHNASYGTTRLHIDGGTDRGQMIIEGNDFAAVILSDNTATANERVFSTQVLDGKYQIKPLNDNGTSTVGGEAITVLHGGNVGYWDD